MGTRKKTTELVFNLQWRNKPDNAGDKSNIVGMYDTPATTLNFETFKSYLLKNSGVVGNDVKVTYLTDNGAEWVIDSQEWFEIALCAFRLKARLGEVIFLKLDKISNKMTRKHSNDAETQFDNDSACSNFAAPPEWFMMYMKQFKRELIEEVTYAVSTNLSKKTREKENLPQPAIIIPAKKVKPELSKRSRKHMMLGETPIDKELLKTLKFDRKLEVKLDKLDAKTKKIKEKKQALISKLENEDRQYKQPQIPVDVDGAPLMNAALVNDPEIIPYMMGGETYLHSWEVINNGKLPWTPKTELRLTWGSAEMKPSTNAIPCPLLQPGEKGTISVRFQIPEKSGQYESYWNFYEREMRFGHWVSCCVIVDVPVSYLPEKVQPKKPKFEQDVTFKFLRTVFPERQTAESPETTGSEHLLSKNYANPDNSRESNAEDAAAAYRNSFLRTQEHYNRLIQDNLSKRMQDVKITSHADSDYSDWESVCSYEKKKHMEEEEEVAAERPKTNKYGINEKDLIVDLSKPKEERKSPSPRQSSVVVVKIEDEKKEEEKRSDQNSNTNDDNNNNGVSLNNNSSGESICEIGSEASDLSSGYDVINTPVCEEKEDSGYVYITIDGNKLPVPKHILRPDFLINAEEAPGPINTEDDEKTITENKPINEQQSSGELIPENPPTETNALTTDGFDQPEARPPQISDKFSSEQRSKIFQKIIAHRFNTEEAAAGAPEEQPATTVEQLKSQMDDLMTMNQNLEDAKSFMSHCSAAGTCFSDVNSTPASRLFIFPQNNPGFEVVCPKAAEKEDFELDPTPTYTWSHSGSRYAFAQHDPDQPSPASSQGQNPTTYRHVPNYQQSPRGGPPPHLRQGAPPSAPPQQQAPHHHAAAGTPPVHILPENLVSGAVNVASSAINTARSVINMIVPKSEPGKWVNGHWVTENVESLRAKNLKILSDMGFWDTDLNATLLARYNDDICRVINELIQ